MDTTVTALGDAVVAALEDVGYMTPRSGSFARPPSDTRGIHQLSSLGLELRTESTTTSHEINSPKHCLNLGYGRSLASQPLRNSVARYVIKW